MSKNGFEISGFDEILLNIEQLGGNVSKASREAVKEGGKVVRDRLEKNTPKGAYLSKTHAKDNVVISNIKTNRDTGDKYVTVGYPAEIKWRIHFVEFGTIRQQPKLFMTKTINDTREEVKKVMMDSLKGAIK